MKTLKYSRQRESIKSCLMARHDHPTADALYTSIREEYPNISLGTVILMQTLHRTIISYAGTAARSTTCL